MVLKKDLGKFFFVINFTDTLTQEDAIEVRQHVVNGLGQLLQWPIKALDERVVLYSAKQVLANSAQECVDVESETNFISVHHKFLEDIRTFSTIRYEELMAAFAENIMTEVAKTITDKLSAAIDYAEGKDQDYLQALEQINAEINDFRSQIHTNEVAFRDEIRKKKRSLLNKIEEEFSFVRAEVKSSITSSKDPHTGDVAWIQKHVRKLIDDKIPPALESFVIEIKGACEDFDLQIMPSVSRSIDNIEGIRKSFDFSSIVAGTGVVTAGYALISVLFPWVAGAAGLGVFGTAVLTFINPAIGAGTGSMLVKAGASGLGSFLSSGSSVLEFAFSGLRDKVHTWVDENDKQRYLDDLDKKIFDMEMAVIKNLDTTITPEKISAAVIDNKFPLKQEIIGKQKQQITMDRELLASNINELLLMRQEILRVMHGDQAGRMI